MAEEEKKCFVPDEDEVCARCANRHNCREWNLNLVQLAPMVYIAGNCKNFEQE